MVKERTLQFNQPQSAWFAMQHIRTDSRPASLYGLAPDRLRPVLVQPAAAGPSPFGQSQAGPASLGEEAGNGIGEAGYHVLAI